MSDFLVGVVLGLAVVAALAMDGWTFLTPAERGRLLLWMFVTPQVPDWIVETDLFVGLFAKYVGASLPLEYDAMTDFPGGA